MTLIVRDYQWQGADVRINVSLVALGLARATVKTVAIQLPVKSCTGGWATQALLVLPTHVLG